MHKAKGGQIKINGFGTLHHVKAGQILAAVLAGIDVLMRGILKRKPSHAFMLLVAAAGAGHAHEAPAMGANRAMVPKLAAFGNQKIRRLGMILQRRQIRIRSADRAIGFAPQVSWSQNQQRLFLGRDARSIRRPQGHEQKIRRDGSICSRAVQSLLVAMNHGPQTQAGPLPILFELVSKPTETFG